MGKVQSAQAQGLLFGSISHKLEWTWWQVSVTTSLEGTDRKISGFYYLGSLDKTVGLRFNVGLYLKN